MEELSKLAQDTFFLPEISERVTFEYIRQLPLITHFCRANNVKLACIGSTLERGYEEPLCFFNDDLGGYTTEGMKNSLETLSP